MNVTSKDSLNLGGINGPARLTVLGCWSPYPRAGGACSGYLICFNNTNILLECGNGVFARLALLADFRFLDAVIISHLHPDHYMDIFCLRRAVEYAIRIGSMSSRLKLFLPGEPEQRYNEVSGFSGAFDIINIEDLPGSTVKRVRVSSLEVEFSPVKHKIRSYAASFAFNNTKHNIKRLVYSADTGYFEQLGDFATGADFFLCEASGLDKDLEFLGEFHLTARQAGMLAARAQVRQLAITHFFPEYDTGQLLAQAREGYREECRDLPLEERIISVKEGETYFI